MISKYPKIYQIYPNNSKYKKISLERGPQGKWGPRAPTTPFTPRTPFKGNCVIYIQILPNHPKSLPPARMKKSTSAAGSSGCSSLFGSSWSWWRCSWDGMNASHIQLSTILNSSLKNGGLSHPRPQKPQISTIKWNPRQRIKNPSQSFTC